MMRNLRENKGLEWHEQTATGERSEMSEMSETIENRVIGIIAAQALRPVSEVTPATSPAALGLDSLGQAEVVFALEEAFGISVPFIGENTPGQQRGLSSVGAIITTVRGLVAARST